jgi:hypothetical protein
LPFFDPESSSFELHASIHPPLSTHAQTHQTRTFPEKFDIIGPTPTLTLLEPEE